MSEISLVLTNDSGSYQALFGQFIESAVADTFADRQIAEAAAASATASQTAAAQSETNSYLNAVNASNQAVAASASATAALASQTSASSSATGAASSQTAAAASANAAGISATNAGNSASAASVSAANAAATLANALVKANNLSDVANATTARTNISAAKSGANSDITSLTGVSNGSNKPVGAVGEFAATTGGTATLVSGTPVNVASEPLTAGDWDISGVAQFNIGTGATATLLVVGVSTTSNTRGGFGNEQVFTQSFGGNTGQVIAAPTARVSVAAGTTAYIVVMAQFSGGTVTSTGVIRARRC